MNNFPEREQIEALFYGGHGNLLAYKEWLFSERPYGYSEAMHQANRFAAMLDAGAYLDAALMLVPEKHGWNIHTPSRPDPDNTPYARLWGQQNGTFSAHGQTPALALVAAVRAAKDAAP